ncbi:hypothetical protein EIP75_22880 [Aquabacterium soli]|uniref:Phage tail tape measure protein n=1 Tax=Aquabacterium soli TaxID=2493092 RepID=A0A426UZI7_9BURK|nr:hypothetical protein [Aquabacterium soli]RRS00050.1 hypothetical protein EIP75_22880 [Aquabacterium soli]
MFEAYSVGVRLTLLGNVSTGLTSMIGHFNHLNRQIESAELRLAGFERKWLELKKGALIGGALTAVGVGLGAVLKGPYEEAKKLEQAKAKFLTLNLSAKENQEAFGTAYTTSQKVLGTAIADNIGLVQDLHTAFGDLHHATEYAPLLAKFVKVAQIQNGEHAGDGLVYNAVKAIEHRGGKVLSDPNAFNGELSRMSQVYVGSGGKVNPSDYFAASQTGKMAYSLASPDFLYGPFAAYMQAKTGSTAATAMMTSFMSLAGGTMSGKTAKFFGDLGMLNKSGKGLSEELVGQYSSRPDQFIWDVLTPAIKQRFGMNLSNEEIAELIARNTNRNTGDFLGWFILNKGKAQKDAAIFDKSKSYAEAYDLYKKTPEGAEQAYHAAMRNLKAIVGTAYLPMIVDGLTKLAPALMSMADWANNHQGTVKGLAATVAALSGLSIIGGVAALVTSAVGSIRLAMVSAGAGFGGAAMGRMGAYAGGAWGAWQVGRLGFALKDLWNAKHHEGVKLTPEAQARLNPVATKAQAPVQVSTQINVDGRKVAQAVTFHQAREAARPFASVAGFDAGLGLSPSALNVR